MTEPTATADQPQERSDHSAFLGDGNVIESTEQDPGTTSVEAGEEVADPELGAESAETSETTEVETDDYLPSEQSKIFPDAEIAKYAAKRYPGLLQRIQENPDDQELRQLLHDKINTDIFLQQQKADAETKTAEVEEPTPTPAVTQAANEEQAKQYQQYVDHLSTSVLDQTKVAALGADLGKTLLMGLGMKPENPKDKAYFQGIEKMGPQLGSHLSKMLVDGVMTLAPYIAQMGVNQAFPEFSGMYGDAFEARSWQRLKSSKADFKDLPDFGSPQWQTESAKAKAQIPNFDMMEFRDAKTGRLLPPHENRAKKLEMLADKMRGQKQTPEQAKAQLEAAKKALASGDRAKAGANLGAGQSTGKLTGAGKGVDPLDEAISGFRKGTQSISSARK